MKMKINVTEDVAPVMDQYADQDVDLVVALVVGRDVAPVVDLGVAPVVDLYMAPVVDLVVAPVVDLYVGQNL